MSIRVTKLHKETVAKKYLPIDLGIAICHLQFAAEHFGKKATNVAVKKEGAKPAKIMSTSLSQD